MFKVCKTDANQKLIKLKKNRLYAGSWVNVINPTNEELEKISAWIKWDVDALKTSLDIDEILGLVSKVNSYKIVGSTGFPFDTNITTGKIGSKGSCVIPLDLSTLNMPLGNLFLKPLS